MTTRVALAVLTVAIDACASAPPATNPQAVTVIERNREGEAHLALPTELPGCKHLGMARVSIPQGIPGLPPDIIDTLKVKAARMGGNTLVLLPGRRIESGSLRGSVFQCTAPPSE